MEVKIRISTDVTLPDGSLVMVGSDYPATIGDNEAFAQENIAAAQVAAMANHTEMIQRLTSDWFQPKKPIYRADAFYDAYGNQKPETD